MVFSKCFVIDFLMDLRKIDVVFVSFCEMVIFIMADFKDFKLLMESYLRENGEVVIYIFFIIEWLL